jgi:hypothetical protein
MASLASKSTRTSRNSNVKQKATIDVFESNKKSHKWDVATKYDPCNKSHHNTYCLYCMEFYENVNEKRIFCTISCIKEFMEGRQSNQTKKSKQESGCPLCCLCKSCRLRCQAISVDSDNNNDYYNDNDNDNDNDHHIMVSY